VHKQIDEHTLEVAKKSISSTIVKVVGMVIGLGLSVFLGRTIRAEGLGIINLTNQIINILIVVGLVGMRQVIVKEIAIAHSKKEYARIGDVMHTAYWLNGGVTLAISVLFIFLSPWISNELFHEPRLTYPLMIALVVLTPRVFSQVFSSALVGYRKIWQSNLANQTLSVAAAGFFLLLLWLFKQEITIVIVAVCYAIGRIVVTITLGAFWRTLYRHKGQRNTVIRQLMKTASPLFFVAIAGIIMTNADTVILGALTDAKNVGLYTVAARIALITGFFLQVTNAAISPKLAALYESGKVKELEKMVKSVTRGLAFFGLVPLLIYILFGRFILSIWGDEFVSAYWILLILSIGQFINISTGAVGLILIMTGFEKDQKNLSLFFLVLNIVALLIFIPIWGVLGAAISTAFTSAGLNIGKLIYVRKRTGINTIGW
jgi:O-antigen/teichoic acid export membrane protein